MLPVLPDEAEKNRESRTIAAKSATDAAAMTRLADGAVRLTGILQDWDDQSEGGGGQGERKQQGTVHPAGCVEGQTSGEPDDQRDDVPAASEAERPAA